MFTCIGKRRGPHGEIAACTNTSEIPSNPARPDWGFLCSDCANAKPNRRPRISLEIPDVDPPNVPDVDPTEAEYQGYSLEDFEPTEQEEIEALEELDLL